MTECVEYSWRSPNCRTLRGLLDGSRYDGCSLIRLGQQAARTGRRRRVEIVLSRTRTAPRRIARDRPSIGSSCALDYPLERAELGSFRPPSRADATVGIRSAMNA